MILQIRVHYMCVCIYIYIYICMYIRIICGSESEFALYSVHPKCGPKQRVLSMLHAARSIRWTALGCWTWEQVGELFCEPKAGRLAIRAEPGKMGSISQLFSDPGKKGNPFWARPFLVGQPPKKEEKGATEQLREGNQQGPNHLHKNSTEPEKKKKQHPKGSSPQFWQ